MSSWYELCQVTDLAECDSALKSDNLCHMTETSYEDVPKKRVYTVYNLHTPWDQSSVYPIDDEWHKKSSSKTQIVLSRKFHIQQELEVKYLATRQVELKL